MGLFTIIGALLGGCATVGHLQSADTVGRGAFEIGLEPGVYQREVAFDDEVVVETDEGERTVNLDLESAEESLRLNRAVLLGGASLRVGLSERLDLGTRWGANGIDLLGKLQLTRPERSAFIVSFVPSVGGFAVPYADDVASLLVVQGSLLAGFDYDDEVQLVLGLKAQQTWARLPDEALVSRLRLTVLAGSAGLSMRLARGLRVMPEVAMGWPVALRAAGVDEGDPYAFTSTGTSEVRFLQGGLAVLIGG